MEWKTPSTGDGAWWSLYRHKQARLTLPLTANWLSFIAEGDFPLGIFEVSATAPQESEEAIVDVDVTYEALSFRDMKVCRLRYGHYGWGLGIFVSTSPSVQQLDNHLTNPR